MKIRKVSLKLFSMAALFALISISSFAQDYQSGSMLYSSDESCGMIVVSTCCESFAVEIMNMETGATEVLSFQKSESGNAYVANENPNFHLYFPVDEMYAVQYMTETIDGVEGKFIDPEKIFTWSHIRSALGNMSQEELLMIAQEGHMLMYPRR